MDCNNCQELFSEYIDRLLDESLRPHLEKHLEECPECAEEWKSFAAAVIWVRQLQFTAPEEILPGIRRKIVNNHPVEKLVSRLFSFLRFQDFSLPMPAAAATLALALAAMLSIKYFFGASLPLFQPQQPPSQNSVVRSDSSDHSGTMSPSTSHGLPKQSMYQQPIQTAATFSDFDSLLPLQQLGMQFVTTDGPTPFGMESASMPSAYPRELTAQQQLFSLLHIHFPPDVKITVNNLPPENRLRLSRKLLNNSSWSAQHFGNDTILLYMDPCKLKKLHGILAGQDVLVMPPDAKDTAFGSPKNILTVAVRLP